MPKMVTLHSTVVHREKDGKTFRVMPVIGKSFNYSDKEVAEFDAVAKDIGRPILREPVNEDQSVLADEQVVEVTPPKDDSKKAATKPAVVVKDDKNDEI